jgi:uncharacterized protein (DUF2147 family)
LHKTNGRTRESKNTEGDNDRISVRIKPTEFKFQGVQDMRILLTMICAVLGAVSLQAEETAAAKKLLGIWVTSDGGARVEIYEKGDRFNGKIVWLEEDNYETDDLEEGEPLRDVNNPDPSKRDAPIIGLNLIEGFSYDSKSARWHKGTIYDPNNGKTYRCRLTLESDTVLNVRGYLGSPVFGRTEIWKRYVPKKADSSGAELKRK